MQIDTKNMYAHLKTIPLEKVSVRDGFWARRQEINHETSLRHAFRKIEVSGNFNNLKLAAGSGEGVYRQPVFMDSDIYKWLEVVTYDLVNSPDPELEAMADQAIDLLTVAQQEDGYLNSYFQVVEPDKKSSWQDALYRSLTTESLPQQAVKLTAVPYYAWANREPGQMRVWIPRQS